MPNGDLPYLLGRVRDLTRRYRAGQPESFDAFSELVLLILGQTVLAPHGGVSLVYLSRTREKAVIGGRAGPEDPLPLRDKRFLRLSITLQLVPTPEGHRLKVFESSYQYQIDPQGERWIFRYDYLRHPPRPHPAAHFQIRGSLTEPDCLPLRTPLERVHFPTHRVSLEAVIRLLADQFRVPCQEPPESWHPVLDESERYFLAIAHPPVAEAAP